MIVAMHCTPPSFARFPSSPLAMRMPFFLLLSLKKETQKEEVCSTEPHNSAVTHTKAVPSRSAMLPRSRIAWARTLRKWQGLNSSGFTAVNVGALMTRIGFWAPLYYASR